MEKIAIFGIGKMGLPLACAFAEKGFDVTGIDVNTELVKRVNAAQDVLPQEPGVHALLKAHAGKNLRATTATDVSDREVVIILVPTLIHENAGLVEPDLTAVLDVAKLIGKTLTPGTIVITECTMPPGATEKIGQAIEKAISTSPKKTNTKKSDAKPFGLAHCPERTSSGTALRDIRGQYPKIIGASDAKTLETVSRIYEKINAKSVVRMPSVKAAECVKVFEGVYRDVNIALANELAKYCESIGVDAVETFAAANTQPYCHLHSPSCGVGGHCIPYYPYFVMAGSTSTPVLRAARATNDAMPAYTIDRLAPKKGDRVAVFGLTFRGGVKEFRKSPGLEILGILKERGAEVFAHDPLCSNDEIRALGATPIRLDQTDGLDGIIVCANHAAFKTLDWAAMVKKMRHPNVVDGVHVVPADAVRKAGGTYAGIGRL
ncbi:nucleotide sugar dehydrogenase [Candidatus Micrarchaeota archaeon]|nr:nucleotide sugar dehydrogenase [Candidatus Micrarchaeota archaeon]